MRHSNTEEPKKRTPTPGEIEQEVQGLWKYVDQKVPLDIWGNLHRKVRKTYIDKRRAYLDSKKSYPTPDGNTLHFGQQWMKLTYFCQDTQDIAMASAEITGRTTGCEAQNGDRATFTESGVRKRQRY